MNRPLTTIDPATAPLRPRRVSAAGRSCAA